MNAPDLTKRPPRSPRVRLGGYTILPRILDKIRAELAGTAGDYKYKNPNDWHFFRFTGIDPAALQQQVATGAGDWDVLIWINENAPLKHTPLEISLWSDWTQTIAFHDVEMRELVIGASCACAQVFGATESLQASGVEEKKDNALAGTPGLLSVRRYLVGDWQVLIF